MCKKVWNADFWMPNPKSVLMSPNDVQALFTQGMTKTIVNVQWWRTEFHKDALLCADNDVTLFAHSAPIWERISARCQKERRSSSCCAIAPSVPPQNTSVAFDPKSLKRWVEQDLPVSNQLEGSLFINDPWMYLDNGRPVEWVVVAWSEGSWDEKWRVLSSNQCR